MIKNMLGKRKEVVPFSYVLNIPEETHRKKPIKRIVPGITHFTNALNFLWV